jgi:hypothetical protein
MSRLIHAIVFAIAVATPAHATFHLAEIHEAMAGAGGDPTVQFVEIRMRAIFQGEVAHTRLTYFDCAGTTVTVLLEVPSDVANDGTDVRWIMASPSAGQFLATFGIVPDFTFPGGIDPSCGNVCWGAPGIVAQNPPAWDPRVPANYVDCVAFGGYSGPLRAGQAIVAGPLGDGVQSLTRVGSAAFSLECPTPQNNAGAIGSSAGCTTTTSSSTTTSTTAAPPVDETLLLDGAKLTLKDDLLDAAKKKVVLTSKDPDVTLGDGNGTLDDPRVSGATVRIVSAAGDTFDDTYTLPASGWRIIGTEGADIGYRYKDKLLVHGPVKSATLKSAKQLKLAAKGSALGHTLVTDPNPVDVVVTVGSVQYCQRYGGAVTFKTPKSFVATLAPAPTACPPPR